LTLPGKFVLGESGKFTQREILDTWSEVTGKKTEYVEISLEDYDRLWPMWGLEMGIMLKFWEEAQEKSWTGEEVITKEELGLDFPLVGIKEAFAALDWSD